MWSYADADDNQVALRTFQYPGPVLCVTQGQTVVVNLTNNLPEASSIVFPGQDGRSPQPAASPGLLTTEAAATRRHGQLQLHRRKPGHVPLRERLERLEAGRDGPVRRPRRPPEHRRELRLYARRPSSILPASTCCSWPRSTPICITRSRRAPRTTSTTLHNRYYMINGRAFPDTVQDNGTALLPNQPYGALVRHPAEQRLAARSRR